MRNRLLLVEDDPRIRRSLSLALDDLGFEVIVAPSGEDALERLEETAVDVVLLDLMLPGIDGLKVCELLRSRGDLPIIVVSARTDTADVIAGLEAGADDFVTKPLVAGVLAARIHALLRRRRPSGDTAGDAPRRVGHLEIHTAEGVVRRSGTVLHLTRTEFRLLAELAAADGRPVTRETLLQRVWGYD